MDKGDILYLRTDEKVEGKRVSKESFNAHIDYLTDVAKERYFMGGGYLNNPGGMIIFSAKDLEEAKLICDGDPLISEGLFTYKLMIWELVIINEQK